MSSRHLQRLRDEAGPGLPHEEEAEEEEEEEEEEVARGTNNNLQYLLDSSEEDESDSEEEEATDEDDGVVVVHEEKEEVKHIKATSTKLKKGKIEDDDDFWIVERQHSPAPESQEAPKATERHKIQGVFRLDSWALNMENELKAKFGQEGAMDGASGGNRRGGGGRGGGGGRLSSSSGSSSRTGVMAQLYARRCFLGPPKEDWPRPPTFVGGGLRMNRVEAPEDYVQEEGSRVHEDWFAFEWSSAFLTLNQDYERVQETCDPNALAIFLAHQPHHAEGLLTLALVFAAHGQMDRAHDYVRRCLFVYEAAYIEAFRSAVLEAQAVAVPRLDIRRRENRTYFAALFRHVQMVGARGLYTTAFEVAKLLLSIDPTGDPTGILLCLDFYALRAGKYDELLQLKDSGLTISRGWKDEDNEDDEDAEKRTKETEDEELEEEKEKDDSSPTITVSALPNICYSCALALLHKGQRPAAKDALRDALLRFPVMLKPLVEKCRNELGSRVTQPWGPILQHGFFSGAATRTWPLVLPRLVAVYVQRCYEVWGSDSEAMQFLYEGAREVAQEVDHGSWGYKEESQEFAAHYFQGSPLEKYQQVNVVDYSDEFPRLPPDVNPLNPALADPAVARRGRLRFNRARGAPFWGGGAAAVRQGGQGLLDRGTLNPDLPLLELFWRSLFPWNTIDNSRQPAQF